MEITIQIGRLKYRISWHDSITGLEAGEKLSLAELTHNQINLVKKTTSQIKNKLERDFKTCVSGNSITIERLK